MSTPPVPRPNGSSNGRFRIRLGLILIALGLLIFLIGAVPGLFSLDGSPVVGFVQIAVFLIGLAFICLGGYVMMNALWDDRPKTILADIGLRLVSTGFVIAVVSGMADIFGFGSQLSPEIPYYGPYQSLGVVIGEAVIAIGFVLMIPYTSESKKPESLFREEEIPIHSESNLIID
jgi:hypothetical protein